MDQNLMHAPQSPLEKVQEQFENWRKNRKKRRPIPKSLWDSAIKLHGDYSIQQITKALRLNYTDFKKKIPRTKTSETIIESPPAFIDVDLSQYIPHAPEYSIELENTKGSKMKISMKGQGIIDVLDSINYFWKHCK